MKKFLLALAVIAFVLSNARTQAQYVTIPDANFRNYLLNAGFANCFVGNQMDTTCPEVMSAIKINAYGYTVADFTGLQYFDNLDTFQYNTWSGSVTTLPSHLPQQMRYFMLGSTANHPLTSLPPLPSTITFLYVQGNSLTSLPTLPAMLKQFWCGSNQLTSLPAIPAEVDTIYCHKNQLTQLPTLPGGLLVMDCFDNELTSLPALPNSMTYLRCYKNQLSTLPNIPTSMSILYAGRNQITSVPPLNNGLWWLHLDHNQLSSLPTLPASLDQLVIDHNNFSTLPVLNNGLEDLICSNNPLPPNLTTQTLPSTLEMLKADSIGLTSLPALPSSVYWLQVNGNQLTYLPNWGYSGSGLRLQCRDNLLSALPDLPPSVYWLDCSNNPDISCLPPFEKCTGTGNFSLRFDNTGIVCLPNHIQHSGSWPNVDTLPLCGMYNNNGCEIAWNIAGTVYKDANGGCVTDGTDPRVSPIKVMLYQSGLLQQQVFTTMDGNYSFNTNIGTYELKVDTAGLPFNVSCPASGTYTTNLITTDSLDYAANFGLTCKPDYDLGINSLVHTMGMFFPANIATVKIKAGDLTAAFGTTCNTESLSGTVQLTFNGPIAYQNSLGSVSPTLVTGNTVTWNVSDFSLVDIDNSFVLSFVTDTFPLPGSFACFDVIISASTGTDNNGSNNSINQCFEVVNSFDPNFKEVSPSQTHAPGDWLTYTIHFQNTGTAAAQHIKLIDTLDANLDVASFQLLDASHHNITQVLPGDIVHFNFPNINLPDSTSNEPESHGWVQYKIKTDATILPNTEIHNTASIYFDFNDPVVTNDAVTVYCDPAVFAQNVSICQGDSVQVGSHYYMLAGTYTTSIPTSAGCDSVITTTVSVLPADATIAMNGSTFTAPANALTYQWINCSNNEPISGATNQSYAGTFGETYAVQLTYANGCAVTSECEQLTGIDGITVNAFALSPNPASDFTTLSAAQSFSNALLKVYDMTGRLMLQQEVDGSEIKLNLANLIAGFYTVNLVTPRGNLAVEKLVVIR